MRRIFIPVVLFFLASAPLLGSPVTGAWAQYENLLDAWTETKRFRGGERAVVSAVGDKTPGAGLRLRVFDAKGTLVAEDKGKEQPAGDMVAAQWYPPRDGDYRIEIRNLQARPNRCYITIK